ncbi:dynamin family protein [Streptomyces sp. NPDC059787]|uniref:dynamin family protein n=1 Tax=Streptomyces sp. NPDC059787 TaxID=3346947 RepID=UPI003647FAFD
MLARAAAKLGARVAAPVSLAVVGEFTVGKSLLLGALLGRPDLLPVEERPATGNITVLRLREGTAGAGTRLGDTSKIHFMTRDRLASCVRGVGDAVCGAEGGRVTAGGGQELGAEDHARARHAGDHLEVALLVQPGFDRFVDLGGLAVGDHWVNAAKAVSTFSGVSLPQGS